MRIMAMSRSTFRALGLFLLAQSLIGVMGAHAQTVVGTVVDRSTGGALGGAFVTLQNADGHSVGGALAGDNGRFVLQAPAPGTYSLRVQFIGYADAFSETFDLAAGETVQRTVGVAVRAVDLDGITAEVGSRCRSRPGTGPETARLWEEVRTALEITSWTQQHAALRFDIIEQKRELDAMSLRVTAIREAGRRGWYDESPYRSIPADSLDVHGYIQPVATNPDVRGAGDSPASQADTLWDYWAPDAAVLVSESFLDTHCFRVAVSDDPERSDLVGLAFEPVPGRALPDIEGTLWVDRGSAELRFLEFTYTNLPFPHDHWPQVGGRVEFEQLATGMWIVRRWRVRMPLAAMPVCGYGGEPVRFDLQSLTEEGAVVAQVRAPDGRILARATGATLYGILKIPSRGSHWPGPP